MQGDDPPPPYQEGPPGASSRLQVPGQTRSGIPPQMRRSMEDENRPVPEGWVRQFDPGENHQFYVDTRTNPPRSIWHHPYDDEEYMLSLTPEERNRIHDISREPAQADIDAQSSNDEAYEESSGRPQAAAAGSRDEPDGARRLGRRVKDALTNTTHEEREARRRRREEEERRAYQVHQRFRAAMAKAAQTGEAQLLGTDSQGKEIWIEPPSMAAGGYGGDGMYGGRGYGLNPFQGPYGYPNSMYMRPTQPYYRPLGYGYGGGYGGYGGMGMGLPLMAGLGGGLMLSSVLF
jgi:hypothetical protein